MKLCDFPYTTTKGLTEYSGLVNGIIDLFREVSLIGIIEEDTGSKTPWGEDRLEYWDNASADICYGRYLQFKNIEKEHIKFWFGLSSTPEQANLAIWFEIAGITAYKGKLRDTFEPNKQYYESPDEVWITMEEEGFDKFCNSGSARKDIIKDFWQSVLRGLN